VYYQKPCIYFYPLFRRFFHNPENNSLDLPAEKPNPGELDAELKAINYLAGGRGKK
jgi:hypothetical protein